MAEHADVQSVEQLELLLQQMEAFRRRVLREVEILENELRKLSAWLEEEAYTYWSQQRQQAQRHHAECQTALTRCLSYVRQDERRPCSEEKKRLQRAEQRLQLCERKLRAWKTATEEWETRRTRLGTRLRVCRELADSELQVGILHLRGQIERLHAYMGLRSPTLNSPPRRDTSTQFDSPATTNREEETP